MSRGIRKITGITIESWQETPIEFVAYDAIELSRANEGAPVIFTHRGVKMTVDATTSLRAAADEWLNQYNEQQKASEILRPYAHE